MLIILSRCIYLSLKVTDDKNGSFWYHLDICENMSSHIICFISNLSVCKVFSIITWDKQYLYELLPIWLLCFFITLVNLTHVGIGSIQSYYFSSVKITVSQFKLCITNFFANSSCLSLLKLINQIFV